MSLGDHTYASAIVDAQKTHKRKEADFYPSPPDVTVALMNFLKLSEGTFVWEPASGDGAMARILERYVSEVAATDLRTESSIYGDGGFDFLDHGNGDRIALIGDPDWIITNPPFNLSEGFIRKALSITPNVAMLLKSQYWHAARRLKLFEECQPAYVLPLTWRPAFLEAERGSSPLMDVIWVVWQGKVNATQFLPLVRPRSVVPLDPIPAETPALDFDFDDILGEALPINSTSCGADHIFGDLL